MNCPYCNSELIDGGVYGFLASHQSGEILGNTYKCPNSEGFETELEAIEYLDLIDSCLEDLGVTTWEDVSCESAVHSVCGSFYTDNNDNLHNGYPC